MFNLFKRTKKTGVETPRYNGTPPPMPSVQPVKVHEYKILDGKEVSKYIQQQVKADIEALDIPVCLAVVIVGEDAASNIYVNNKKKACKNVNIQSLEIRLPADVSEEELLNVIDDLNNDNNVHGILVQLPLPNHINEKKVIHKISAEKDVDGFTAINTGKLWQGDVEIVPCTPAGVIELLDYYNIEIEGKNCVIVGRSNIVGKPMAALLLARNGAVTVCHSKTKNLTNFTKQADILIVAIGKSKFITADMVKQDAVVVDVGINRGEDGKICGDVDFDDVKNKAAWITPVPGGCGPMTIAMLMKNTATAVKCNLNNGR